jgi:hypothetical protein
MKSFSQRMGLKPVKNSLQTESIDDDLRNSLWNEILQTYFVNIDYDAYGDSWFDMDGNKPLRIFIKKLYCDFFKWTLDVRPNTVDQTRKIIKTQFFELKWNEVYDFIEFSANNYPNIETNQKFIERCNSCLIREMSAFRFVGGIITQITSEQEIQEIEEAIKRTDSFAPVQEHLTTALKFLSDRKKPDFRNSIKETISAVESLCNLMNGKKSTLGKTIDILESKVKIHGALKEAFSNLYGWTSDADGIRHGMMDYPNLDFEDAKFMLVSCSAFINYLIVKAQKAGIKGF